MHPISVKMKKKRQETTETNDFPLEVPNHIAKNRKSRVCCLGFRYCQTTIKYNKTHNCKPNRASKTYPPTDIENTMVGSLLGVSRGAKITHFKLKTCP